MKKIGLFIASLCMSIIFLTSCMKGSNVWEGPAFGVVNVSSKTFTPIIQSTAGDVYSSTIMTLMEKGDLTFGDCVYIYLNIDFDLPENSPTAIDTYGYQTVSIQQIALLSKCNLNYYLTDTATVLPGEVPILKVYNGGSYVAGHFFIEHSVNIADDWELTWDMSFDNSSMMPKIEGDKRYYDLYVRARVTKETDKTSKSDRPFLNVYNMGSYFTSVANAERAILGSNYNEGSKFTLRFNYPSGINNDTNTITWSSNEVEEKVASFQTSD